MEKYLLVGHGHGTATIAERNVPAKPTKGLNRKRKLLNISLSDQLYNANYVAKKSLKRVENTNIAISVLKNI